MKNLKILAIETSCDDTCMSVLENNEVIDNVIISSAQIQNNFGGVVPELAARYHEKNIIDAFNIIKQKYNLEKLDYIAYTNEPGLRVCLNVGEAFATSLSKIINKPLIKINHIYAHIFSFANKMQLTDISFPFLGLVVSGGHSSIFLVESPNNIKLINETIDDAIGEVYDKIARSLNLGYPGGPIIDQMYEPSKAILTFVKTNFANDKPYSFSGIKTAVLNYINQAKMKHEKLDIIAIISSFQKQVINGVLDKLTYYMHQYKIYNVAIGGGVSANSLLQSEIKKIPMIKHLYIPTKKIFCGDNAAMIAIYANLLIQAKNNIDQ